MVGVPGKFKGCNTCRSRRVKCDNARPHCKKCLDTGRECGGYARERVFIVGTARDQGRCSSHPHRSLLIPRSMKVLNTKKRTSHAERAKVEKGSSRDGWRNERSFDEVPGGVPAGATCLAVQATLEMLEMGYELGGETFIVPSTSLVKGISTSSYPLGLTSREAEFEMRAVCLFDRSDAEEGPKQPDLQAKMDRASPSTYVFVYELRPSSSPRSSLSIKVEPGLSPGGLFPLPFQHVLGGSASQVQQRGPEYYTSFPRHHFFAHLFRPHLTFYALTYRQPNFLADNEWCSTPWQDISKTSLDILFDTFVLLPEIFARGEELETHPSTISRRLHARDLLEQCAGLDLRLETWLHNLNLRHENPAWKEIRTANDTIDSYQTQSMPWFFDTRIQFRDFATAEMMLYYWAGLCTFYRAVQHIHAICAAEIPVNSPSAVEMKELRTYNETVTTNTPLSTQGFTPPQKRQGQETIFGAEWNQAFMPPATAESMPPLYTSGISSFNNYIPDPFISPTGFAPDIPVDFSYPAAEAFLSTGVDVEFEPFLPPTTQFADTPAFYSFESTFLIPATPTTSTTPNVGLPTSGSFPTAPSFPTPPTYPSLSPDPITYLLAASVSRHNSASRAHSFSHSASYIHSRSPTPTAISSAPSSNPSLRNSVSNPTSNPSNPNSVVNSSGGYASTPPPTSTPLVIMGTEIETPPPLPTTPTLDVKFGEENVTSIASNILKAVPLLVGFSSSPSVGRGFSGTRADRRGSDFQGGAAVPLSLREAIKVFRRQGRAGEVEFCKRLLDHGIGNQATGDITGRIWREHV